MGLKIKHISGEVKSANEKAIILIAEKTASFQIEGLQKADILNNQIEWILRPQNKKGELKKTKLRSNEPFLLTIDKFTSGSYTYHLQAYYTSISKQKEIETDSICVSSYCVPKMVDFRSSTNGEIVPGGYSDKIVPLNPVQNGPL